MRTTVRLPDDLYRAAKLRAAERGTTFTALLEDALRTTLAAQQSVSDVGHYDVRPLRAGRGPQPGIDLDDTAALLDVMEQQ